MNAPHNPQAEQMADASMLRTLAAQAEAIWPQERPLFERYTPAPRHIADIGCGSGEITARLAQHYPRAEIVGVDILPGSIAHAHERLVHLGPRVHVRQGDVFALELGDGEFDLVVCRHLIQAIPQPAKALAELVRICRPGGWLHVLAEDYGMLHMPVTAMDTDRLWHEAVVPYTRSTGTDARIGRRCWSLLQELGLEALQVDYAIVDTLRVPRDTFAAIMLAWRDGYAAVLAEHSAFDALQIRALFDQVIASIRDPGQYAVWQVPIVSGRKPAQDRPDQLSSAPSIDRR